MSLCRQCGQPFAYPACGPTHASEAARQLDEYPRLLARLATLERVLLRAREDFAQWMQQIDAALDAARGV